MATTKKIRTRFAPSPTGFLHIGGLRTALYAFALAKHSKGDFILRIEDTDRKREVEGSKESLKKTLKNFNLIWDELYVQSERNKEGIYEAAAKRLVKEGHAFYCQCESKNAKEEGYSTVLRDPCRDKEFTSGAIKLKVPENKVVSYFDFVHKKEISWNTKDVYDATLLKSDGFPTYHLAAMVDDLDMKITHILRGHDWLPSTPIHLLVFEFLGAGKERPEIGNLTDILSAETGRKLSKRRDSVFVEQFIKDGYLPEALLNFIMLLGWAPKDNQELFTLREFVKHFDIAGFQDANPRFLTTKLDWFNGYYIRKLSVVDLKTKFENQSSDFSALDEEKKLAITNLVQDRIKKITDIDSFASFFWKEPNIDKSLLDESAKKHLGLAINVIEDMSVKDFNDITKLNEALMKEIEKNGIKVGDFFMTLRIAITGSKFTPPINDSIIIIGRDETLKRLKKI